MGSEELGQRVNLYSPEQPREPAGSPEGGQFAGSAGEGEKNYGHLTERQAEKQFYSILRRDHPAGVTLYHESPIANAEKIDKEGLNQETTFATIERPSGFVTKDKVVVSFIVYKNEYSMIHPDMRYEGNGKPFHDLLVEHNGIVGADVAYDDRVLRGDIKSISRVTRMSDEGSGKRISAVVGKKSAGGSMELQTFVFLPKAKWERADVVKWLKAHDKKAEIDETDTSYRARQADPDDFIDDTFRTILITDDPEKMADTIVDNTLLADTIKGKHTPDLIARGTAQKMTNLVGQNARNIAEDLTSDDVMADDAEDLIVSALHRYAESKLVRIAEEAVLQAYRAGRADELDDFSDEMAAQGREVQWFRSSVLSPSTCGPCEDADGSPIDSADEDLSDICEGGENCRCMPFADLAEEI